MDAMIRWALRYRLLTLLLAVILTLAGLQA